MYADGDLYGRGAGSCFKKEFTVDREQVRNLAVTFFCRHHTIIFLDTNVANKKSFF